MLIILVFMRHIQEDIISPSPEKETQKGKMKNTKAQRCKRCENVKVQRCKDVKM